MGITIHYSLKTDEQTEEEVRKIIHNLREQALELDLVSVSDIIELTGEECDLSTCDKANRTLVTHARLDISGEDEVELLAPAKIIGFVANPGIGSEACHMALCKRANGEWNFHVFCKTQYASDAGHGGVANFLKSHTSAIKLLDLASTAGLEVTVRDECGYWQHRDEAILKESLETMNKHIETVVERLSEGDGNLLRLN
ncbi:hypothetical protein SV7mr_19960 [Stieleria bergensis]|uniref:Uncharacterized protein n=1 Tax=Stieleria bergensis TaxID=2528025 RepID=A0A517STN1_9BACT|nr:hypothetical protein SV7mr_19960 [Planctomycetes bacterium SV_7m_r]